MRHPTESVKSYLLGLQGRIVEAVQAVDGRAFITDDWQREPGGKLQGEGRSRLLEDGALM